MHPPVRTSGRGGDPKCMAVHGVRGEVHGVHGICMACMTVRGEHGICMKCDPKPTLLASRRKESSRAGTYSLERKIWRGGGPAQGGKPWISRGKWRGRGRCVSGGFRCTLCAPFPIRGWQHRGVECLRRQDGMEVGSARRWSELLHSRRVSGMIMIARSEIVMCRRCSCV
jgi:hypothetical protein